MSIQNATQQLRENLVAIDGGKISDYKLPTNICTVSSVIPAQIQSVINSQFKAVGLNFDINSLVLAKDNQAQIKQIKQTVELIKRSKDLLPMLKSALVTAMKAAKTQAEFNRDIAVEALKNQAGIDKAQADVLVALAGYAQKRTAQELRLEYRVKRLEKTKEAMTRKYNESWGAEAEYIDSRRDDLIALAKKRYEAKANKSKTQTKREKERIDYKAELD